MPKLLFMLPLILLFLVPVAMADFPDGFDTYPSGATSPFGPWSMAFGTPGCWVGSSVLGVNGSAQTAPNIYDFAFTAGGGCGAAEQAILSFTENASQPEIAFSYYLTLASGTAPDFLAFNSCSSATVATSPVLVGWNQYTMTWAQATGSTCVIKLQVTSGAGSFFLYVDTAYLRGANAVIPGYDFTLVHYATQQWLNISGYSGSSLRVNYKTAQTCSTYGMIQASPTVCLLSGLTVPDLFIGTSFYGPPNPTLITVNVGGSVPYTRTIIPPPNLLHGTTPGNISMYLDEPSIGTIFSYTLTIDDLTSSFPVNSTQVYVQQGGFVITSGYLDSASHFAMTMQPGLYTLTLLNPTHPSSPFTYPLTLTNTISNPSVIVQNSNQTVPLGAISQYLYNLGWDCDGDGATSTFTDTLGTMTSVTTTLYRNNATVMGYALATHTDTFTPSPPTPESSTIRVY